MARLNNGRRLSHLGVASHEKPNFDPYKDKACIFFSCGSPKNVREVLDVGIKDVLVSYHYLRKNLKIFTHDLLPEMRELGGIYMTDSGAFSILNSGKITEDMFTEEYWVPYIEEYVNWVYENSKNIYVVANMDIDNIVGRDVVDKWNEKYFRPLEEVVNVCYVVQADVNGYYGDKQGLKRMRQYSLQFDYIGAASSNVGKIYKQYYREARLENKRVHGFGWTSYERLKEAPFFSVDSTTWLAASQFGATFFDTGASFKRIDKVQYMRKRYKLKCEEMGIDYDDLMSGRNSDANNRHSLIEWLGFRRDYLKSANTKLITEPIMNYAKF